MKTLYYGLFVFALAAGVGVLVAQDPGYALFSYGHWSLEMPLWLLAFLGLLLTVLLMIFSGVLRSLIRIPGWLTGWSKRRHLNQSQQLTRRGLIDLAEGSWARAERSLLEGAKSTPSPLINYLAAARAAQEQNAYERRDDYLRLAHKSTPDAKVAVGLTQAECQLNHGQLEQALATLQHLQTLVPHHPHVLALLKDLYLKLEDWDGLLQLVPLLRKYGVLTKSEGNALLASLQEKKFQTFVDPAQHKEATALWQSLPKWLRQTPAFLKVYCETLLRLGDSAQVEPLLRDSIKQQWDLDLVLLYGEVASQDNRKQLAQAESWLKSHPNSPILYVTLARLSMRNQLWGKAKDYAESSLSLHKRWDALQLLGELQEALGEKESAMVHYRDALQALASQKK